MSRDERSGHASPAFARMQCHLRHLRGRNWYATCHSPPRWSARERREACVPCSPQPALSTSSNDESFNAAERIFFFCVASWPPPNPAPDDFDPGFASTVYFRLGGIAIAHSFLRTPEVINFLLHMKSKQDHSDATETGSRSAGAVRRNVERPCSFRALCRSLKYHSSPRGMPCLNRQSSCSGRRAPHA